MEAVDSQFERVKPLFDQVSMDVAELTAQSESREGSQITVAIAKRYSVGEIVFLGQFMQECNGWIGASLFEDCDITDQP